jgi:hypothetical protein
MFRRLLLTAFFVTFSVNAYAWTVTGTELNSPGWWTFERDGKVTSDTSEYAPTSPPSSIRIYEPAGTVTSTSNSGDPAMWGTTLPSATSELWIQVWFKYKSNFDFHGAANKLIYIYNAAHQPMFVIDGPTPGEQHMRPWVGAPFGSRALFPNLTTTSITAGNWYKLKIHINVSTGLFEFWVNDVKNGSYSGVTIGSTITEVNFTPVWGGTGKTGPAVDNYQWYDDAYISNDTQPGASAVPPGGKTPLTPSSISIK